MRTRREGAVQDQTWVTSNPRELQGSRGTQSRLDRGAAQRKSPSPASSSQWPALISAVSVVRPSARFSLCLLRLLWLLLSGPRRPLCGVSLPFSSKLWWVVCAHPPGPPPPSRPQSLVNTVVSSPVACLLYCVSLPCHPARLSLSGLRPLSPSPVPIRPNAIQVQSSQPVLVLVLPVQFKKRTPISLASPRLFLLAHSRSVWVSRVVFFLPSPHPTILKGDRQTLRHYY